MGKTFMKWGSLADIMFVNIQMHNKFKCIFWSVSIVSPGQAAAKYFIREKGTLEWSDLLRQE